jgi:hypothetical protein
MKLLMESLDEYYLKQMFLKVNFVKLHLHSKLQFLKSFYQNLKCILQDIVPFFKI